mgnify:FL=1
MKKRIIIMGVLAMLVGACSTVSKYIPSDFDSTEFGRLAELHVVASQPLDGENWCGTLDLGTMWYHASILAVYSEHRLNENIAGIYDEILSLTTELKDRENPSEPYCKIKRTNISKITNDALMIFGDRK